MRAIYIFLETIYDQEKFAEYRNLVMPTLKGFDAKFVVRGGEYTLVEGAWPYERTVAIEFPSREAAEAWYHSPEYQKILPLRLQSTSCSAILIDAVA